MMHAIRVCEAVDLWQDLEFYRRYTSILRSITIKKMGMGMRQG